MTDDLTPEQRSYAMSRVRSRGNESTEQRMVLLLKAAGLKGWRRHLDLPGKPDFAFRRERVAVFVDGCFWHRCPRCFRMPTTNDEYWIRKIGRNVARDRRVARELRARGWVVVRVWEHSLKEPERVVRRLRRVLSSASASAAGHPDEATPLALPHVARNVAPTGASLTPDNGSGQTELGITVPQIVVGRRRGG